MKSISYQQEPQHWFTRYKLYHIPFWAGYHYVWWSVGMGDPIEAARVIFYSPFSVKFIFYVLVQASAVCVNSYLLMPALLEKNRITKYIISLTATLLAAAALIVPGYYLSAWLSGSTMDTIYGAGKYSFSHFFITNTFPSTVASMTLGMSIRLTRKWIQTKRRQQLLEKEKLESELRFLKYQFNPHFLFNTINSIFFLIHKNPKMASASLAKFSELLRYQLYECNDKQISLDREITYLENFIQLEKLRQNDNIEVSLQVPVQQTGHLAIAPFVLMTFVENAFKHVSQHSDRPNRIDIDLQVRDQQLQFSISNSSAVNATRDVIHYGGIGLSNVQRRLDLLYSGQYTLDIQRDANSFTVHLTMELAEFVAFEPIPQTA
jgi:two-component system, LytTR family, sensor kinase